MTSENIQQLHHDLNDLLTREQYISHKQASDQLQTTQQALPTAFFNILRLYTSMGTAFRYVRLRRLMKSYETRRNSHNNAFIRSELILHKTLFDTVERFPLDMQQRRAVIADEDNSLIIAGAGSGKTSTIVAKIKYLIEARSVTADTILPISFTNKSAADMKRRVNMPGVSPQTFHKFGLTVLEKVEHAKPAIFDESNNNKLFRSFLEDLSQDISYLTALNSFFMNYIKIPKSQFDFNSRGEYIQYLKDQNFTTYKRIRLPHTGRETYRNETVKSIEECMIANFLIFNRVDYAYEAQYGYPRQHFGKKKRYKPDFTITIPSGKIYLEHLGMDRSGNVPPFFAAAGETCLQASQKYQRQLRWKRQTHTENKTTLIESYSYQFREGTLIADLTKNLTDAGVELHPMSEDEIWHIIQNAGKDQVDGFISLCQTFMSLLKSNGHTIEHSRKINEASDDNKFLKERARLFLDLCEPIFERYENNLLENNEIDFNDMINRATDYIENNEYQCNLNYVIVDEFQDLSFGRYRVLAAIRKQNPDVKFYCVGDDWQSIYRFAGSDIALFRDFQHFFGFTHLAKLETTYRFNDPLITMSSEFILKNPNQTQKSLQAPKDAARTSHNIIESDSSDGDDTPAIISAIHIMIEQGLEPSSEVYIIGRYNFDIKRIQNRSQQFVINPTSGLITYTFSSGKFAGETLRMNFVTAHKSKGLEADYTILINCNSGKYGFPSGKADDPILNLLLSSADQYEHGEERRLFYVAMTRTKRHVTFITDRYRKSTFITELQAGHDGRVLACPDCITGELVLRDGTYGAFYGCSNYAYGCRYSKAFTDKVSPSGVY